MYKHKTWKLALGTNSACIHFNTAQAFYNDLEQELCASKDITEDKVTASAHTHIQTQALSEPIGK